MLEYYQLIVIGESGLPTLRLVFKETFWHNQHLKLDQIAGSTSTSEKNMREVRIP